MHYLLQGGKTSLQTARNQDFFQKVAKMPSPILFIYFARHEHEWEQKFEEDTAKIQSLSPNMQCILASKDSDCFMNQLRQAQTVFIGGGSTAVLKTKLKEIPSLTYLLASKFIVGTSAGACVLSTYYVNDQQEVCSGMGFLPLKIFCHYDETKDAALNQLKKIGQKNLIVLLPEADFAEISF